jgi:hypothetical protein
MPTIPAWGWRQENQEFKTSLGYIDPVSKKKVRAI